MTPSEKRAAATDKRVAALKLIREAVVLEREAALDAAELRASRFNDD